MSTDLFIVVVATGRVKRFTEDQRSSRRCGPWWIVFARSRKPARSGDAPKQDLYLMKPAEKRLSQTHLHQSRLPAGRPDAGGVVGGRKRLLAEFVGQDTSYPEIVKPSTGQVRRVGTAAQGLVGYALSHEGRSILATTGGPDPNDSNVVTVPYGGSKLRVLARHAHSPD